MSEERKLQLQKSLCWGNRRITFEAFYSALRCSADFQAFLDDDIGGKEQETREVISVLWEHLSTTSVGDE